MLRFTLKFWRQFRTYLLAGLMVWVPLIVTVWVSWAVVDKVGTGLESVFGKIFDYYRDWLGVLCALAIFLTTGFLARYWAGRKLIGFGESILDRIPFVSRIYAAVRQVTEVFVSRNGTVFQKVCLIEYPRPGMITVAFVTSTDQGLVQETVGKKLLSIFVPTTPNPTSGYLVYLPEEQVTLLNMKIEEAMKLIVSAGAYLPDQHVELDGEEEEKDRDALKANPE